MKYIQKFENIEKNFKVGDYIIVTDTSHLDSVHDSEKVKYLLKNTVGRVTSINFSREEYTIEYDENIENFKRAKYRLIGNEFVFKEYSIRYATNKEIEDYKMELTTNKYNI